jgi:Zn-dependent protease
MLKLSLLQNISIWILPILFAITLHEAAHAWVANYCGDTTAKRLGRLSLNPIRHIDLIGTVLVPILVAALTQFQFVFGWAKPVPIRWAQLKNPRRDMALVAAAGPASNLIMAILWACCLKVASLFHPDSSNISLFLALTAEAGIFINLVFALLNILPIPPLDGSRILCSLLAPKYALLYLRLEPYGFIILLILLFSGLFNRVLETPLSWLSYWLHYLI